MEQWKEWRVSTCGVAIILVQRVPETDCVTQTYLDCIPFCKHYVYDGDAMFCELGHEPKMSERPLQTCNDKASTGFTLRYALERWMESDGLKVRCLT